MVRDITILFNIIGVGNLFLLGVYYLIRNKKKENKNYLLSAIFFILGWITLNTVFNYTEYSNLFFLFESISNALLFALAPTLYLYIKTFYKKVSTNLWFKLLIPFYIYLFLAILAESYPLSVYFDFLIEKVPYQIIWNLYFLIYLYKTYELSFIENRRINFLSKALTLSVSFTWFVNLILIIYRYVFDPLPSIIYLNITLFFVLISVLYLYSILNGVSKKGRFTIKKNVEEIYISSEELLNKIITENFYRNPELDIRLLSSQLSIPYYKLSTFIHNNFDQNFNDFINSIRVKEFLKEVDQKNYEQKTIVGLSNSVGFKSPSVFYKYFKKETGTTPVKYINKLHKL